MSSPATPAAPNLGLDFHCHLLPAVDDGMADFAEARTAILRMKEIGYTGAVLTPHIYQSLYYNTATSLRRAYEAFAEEIAAAGMTFELHLAAEYFIDDHLLDLISRDELLFVQSGQDRLVLVELPLYRESPYAEACLSGLALRGYRPVIAHVERYRTIRKKPQPWLDYFAAFGAMLQGNIGSLTGQYGESVRLFAEELRARDAISIWGTDLHQGADLEHYIRPGLAHLSFRMPIRLRHQNVTQLTVIE